MMDRSLRVRTFVLAGLLALCVAYLLPTFVAQDKLPSWFPFDKKIQLGLDLQGGVQAVYRIDFDKAIADKAASVRRDLEIKLQEKGIAAKLTMPGNVRGGINVKLTDPAKKAEADALVIADHKGEIQSMTCPAEPETTLCYRIATSFADGIRKSAIVTAVSTVKKRVNERGVSEPNVIQRGQKIIVELPGLDESVRESIKELIKRTAKLEFKIVDNDNPYMTKLYQRLGRGDVAADPDAAREGVTAVADTWTNDKNGEVFDDYYLKAHDRNEATLVEDARKSGCYRSDMTVREGRVMCNVTGRRVIERYLAQLVAKDPSFAVPDQNQLGFEEVFPGNDPEIKDRRPFWRTYLLERAARLDGTTISKATVNYDQNTLRPEVIIYFNRYGGRVFGNMTGENVGKKMAIVLDDKIASAPIIQQRIAGGVSTITMGGVDADSMEREANDLVNVLRTGALPAPLQEEQMAELGPTLGRDAVSKAQLSFILGSILVFAMMLGIYKWAGLVAILSLLVNILLQLGIMATSRPP
jgi:preprotein translocase subunit SecD